MIATLSCWRPTASSVSKSDHCSRRVLEVLSMPGCLMIRIWYSQVAGSITRAMPVLEVSTLKALTTHVSRPAGIVRALTVSSHTLSDVLAGWDYLRELPTGKTMPDGLTTDESSNGIQNVNFLDILTGRA